MHVFVQQFYIMNTVDNYFCGIFSKITDLKEIWFEKSVAHTVINVFREVVSIDFLHKIFSAIFEKLPCKHPQSYPILSQKFVLY